ncbi:accessory Sec system protein Asp2 [Macrococcus animalis]|uniref:accessory Sec system protein Asp2 n=1 Tax=Macrococcus animalis TaxID=3395467 RepID=UPI0039BEAB66
MRKIFKVLQIGNENYSALFNDPKKYYWKHIHPHDLNDINAIQEELKLLLEKVKVFDFILIQTENQPELLEILDSLVEPYNTYVEAPYWPTFQYETVVQKNIIRSISAENKEDLIEKVKTLGYVGQFGDKIHPKMIVPNKTFKDEVIYNGNKEVVFKGNFGSDFKAFASWKYNIFYEQDRAIELWPEFSIVGEDIDVRMIFRMIPAGLVDTITEEFVFDLKSLNEPILFKRRDYQCYLSVSIEAKGSGTISLGALHRRWSRLEFGEFFLGGNRFVDQDRNEFIYFFHPGDMKPPLNVYFSGYRSAEGFEGFYMMKSFEAPFLLIADPRLEGGSFYMGSDEYEKGILNVIQNSLKQLDFKSTDLILTGLSMGSFGALYYGAQLQPAAVIAGKPLINVGTIADNMKLLRPNDFGTANDILLSLTGGTSTKNIQQLNDKFWNKFSTADLRNTTFGLSYMMHDDYDLNAFPEILDVLTQQQAKIISRGISGRHNDDSTTINNWFVHFLNLMLETKFGRKPYDRK